MSDIGQPEGVVENETTRIDSVKFAISVMAALWTMTLISYGMLLANILGSVYMPILDHLVSAGVPVIVSGVAANMVWVLSMIPFGIAGFVLSQKVMDALEQVMFRRDGDSE